MPHLIVLTFCSFLSGSFAAIFTFALLDWNTIQKDLIGNFISGRWYIIPIVLSVALFICVIIGTIKSFIAVRAESNA